MIASYLCNVLSAYIEYIETRLAILTSQFRHMDSHLATLISNPTNTVKKLVYLVVLVVIISWRAGMGEVGGTGAGGGGASSQVAGHIQL